MSVFDSPYFRINKFFLTCTGLWPYLSSERKLFTRIIVNTILIIYLIPTSSGLYEIWGKLDLMVECFIPVFTGFGCLMCSMTCIYKEKEIKKLLNHIKRDWEFFSSEGDITALECHAKSGRILTLLYSGCMISASFIFILTTISPQILDILIPLNETRPKKLAANVKYFFSWEEYFYYVVLHLTISSVVEVAVVIGCRSTFSVFIEHACGLFANVGHRLQKIMHNINMDKSNWNPHLEEKIYRDVTFCIECHQHAIEFTKIIESCFSACFFIIMGITVILLSATLIQSVLHIDRFDDAAKFGSYSLGLILDLYFNNVPGQRLLDGSSYYLSNQVFGGKWYKLPLKSKKLLIMIIMRTNFPCTLTVGKLFVLNMNNFSKVLHASVSYFTLLSSLRT
ncbi:uncharacterized protein LOC127286641 [Leptopilina boulardi]|uniref:uncharacterized protein LOC127286641 n=1 Tax=Leptopilina boulardi TaxID=63433 RepID=UPI0021F5A1B9|nr:uncharacterized protein LOC127286641 [Leptopilina boulardi]